MGWRPGQKYFTKHPPTGHVRPPLRAGRRKGSTNLATREIRVLSQRLFEPPYWTNVRRRLLAGRCAPYLEARLLAYAYGEPSQIHEVPGLEDLAAALQGKIIHELHPSHPVVPVVPVVPMVPRLYT